MIDLKPEPIGDEAGRRETDDEAIMRAVVEREVTVPEPDEETCRRYYENNKARFRSPDIYEASHILFAALPSNPEAYAQAQAEAAGVLTALRGAFQILCRSGAGLFALPFGGAGRQSRADRRGTNHAGIRAGADGAFARRACAEPVATRYGFHVIRLDRRHDGRLLPYEVVAGRIADTYAKASGGARPRNTSRAW